MAPSGGIINRAVAGLGGFGQDGPGWLYYGINAADRGLGYDGSYMTLGGFFPTVEDDLGGLWSADLRGHLSEYGGFFSNVGAVRKQFLGGSILGVGVYWDYDGDMDQFKSWSDMANEYGSVFNQVGISGEWLTDIGSGRVNGYIPVGSTEFTQGTADCPFFGHEFLAVPGFYGALAGVDGEVGLYIPGLADWAGMISLGGYGYGASNLPAFGGVYTRLDMTFINNWDFSLQANNDSFFDWTGFARLTYRMGGSRRRNVPDQMEQPMMRNEHIVRAARDREAAVDPATQRQYYVVHVDNTAAPGGDGTFERPYASTAAANANVVWAAGTPGSIMYVDAGNGTSLNYDSQIQVAGFQQLLGSGVTHSIATQMGIRSFRCGTPGADPILTNTSITPGNDAAVLVSGNGAVVSGLTIEGATVGIRADGNVNLVTTPSRIDDVRIRDSGVGLDVVNVSGGLVMNESSITGGNTAIAISNDAAQPGALAGDVTFTDVSIVNPQASAFVVGNDSPGSGGSARIDFNGRMEQVDGTDRMIKIQNTTGGVVNIGEESSSRAIRATGGQGMLIARTGGDVNISNFTFEGATGPGATGVVEIFETVPGASRVAISDGRIADGFGTGVHIVNSRAVVENVSVVNMADKPGSLPDDFIRLGQGFYVQQTGAGGVSTVRLEGNRVSNSASTTATGFLLEAPNGTLNATLGGNSVSGVGDLALSLFVTNGANGVVYLDSGSRFAGGVNGFNAGLGARLEKIGVAPTSFNIVQQDAETFTERNGGTVEYVPDEDAFQFNVPSPLPQP